MNHGYQFWRKPLKLLMAVSLAALLAACGGSSDSPPPNSPPGSGNLTLSIEVVGAGTVVSQPDGINCSSAICTGAFAPNTAVTLTATPAAGQSFAGWSGACAGAANTCVVTMDPVRIAVFPDVTARFVPSAGQSTYSLSLTIAGAGTVVSNPAGINCTSNCGAVFPANTAVTLTATPAAGQVFAGWGGACSGAATTCRVPMTDATNVTAAFVAAPPPSVVGWSAAELLSPGGAARPRVGIDAAGNATIVWLQQGSGTSSRDVWTSRRPVGGTWSAPALLESIDTDFGELDLAVDAASGKAVAVWRGATTAVIYSRLADAAGAWGPATTLSGAANNFNDLQAGIDTNGNAAAVWSQTPVGSLVTSIWSNRYTAANGWGGAVRVSVAANDRQDLDPSLAVGASGQAFIVWTRNGTGIVASQAPTTGGAWTEPTTLAAGQVSTGVGAPRVAADANGGAMAVWAQGARDANNVIVTNLTSKRFANGAWSGTAVALYTPAATSVLADVRLAVNGSGQFAAVWAQVDTSIRSAQSNAAGGWTPPQVVRLAVTELDGAPAIAIDSAGNMFATWTARANPNSSTPGVWLNQFSPASGWAEAALHHPAGDLNVASSIAMNDRGNAVMGWTRLLTIEGTRIVSRYFTSGR